MRLKHELCQSCASPRFSSINHFNRCRKIEYNALWYTLYEYTRMRDAIDSMQKQQQQQNTHWEMDKKKLDLHLHSLIFFGLFHRVLWHEMLTLQWMTWWFRECRKIFHTKKINTFCIYRLQLVKSLVERMSKQQLHLSDNEFLSSVYSKPLYSSTSHVHPCWLLMCLKLRHSFSAPISHTFGRRLKV